ncbi:MAG TPA: hypothetical protein DCZ95_12805 [Verrucomicrobia bacterium]|nr:MAG: hypothetical protein A2X46_11855 [Lentisphaerae bacterium GWF2_57_35]HBA84967.1 hypothetical protein [Verrucomicrobiota bacterium]
MDSEGARVDLFAERPRTRHHVMAWGVAAAVSVALHAFILQHIPPLPIGRPAAFDATVRIPSLQLQDVLKEFVGDRIERPARFRPESPERTFAAGLEQAQAAQALAPEPPQAPAMPESGLRGDSGALLSPEKPVEHVKWEPRQDLLLIEDQIYAEKVSALPRRYIERESPNKKAPNISLPASIKPLPLVERKGAPGVAKGAGRTDIPLKNFAEVGRGQAGAGRGGAWDGFELAEQSQMLEDPASVISELKPVEQLLALDVSTYRPTDEPEDLYFRIRIRRQGAEILPVLPRDVIFLQDCSASMTQSKLNEFKKGLTAWMDELSPEDRWNIMGFSETPDKCMPTWAPVTATSKKQALAYIDRMAARGKTDVFASLQELLSFPKDPVRPVVAVLLTDGRPTSGMVDSSDIIEQFTQQNAGRISMFALGAGNRVNRFLLDMLSYKNRGDSTIVAERQEVPGAMMDMDRQLARPVLIDLDYRISGRGQQELYPRTLTHLYLDRPLTIYGKVPVKTPDAVLQIVGKSGSNRHDMVFSLKWAESSSGDAEIRSQWAWHKVYYLIGEHIRRGKAETMDEIRRLADAYGLPVPYGGDIPLP